MSFIFERISSGKSVNSRSNFNELSGSIFEFQKPQIPNAKKLSEIEWKSILFKSLNCLCSLFLIVNVLLFKQYSSFEDQQLLSLTSSLFAGSSTLFYLFGYLNQKQLQSGALLQKYQPSYPQLLKFVASLIFCLAHPHHILDNVEIVFYACSYKVNSFLGLFVILRIFSIIAFLIEISRFYGLRVSRVLQIYAVKKRFNLGYTIKCLFKENNFKTPIFLLILGLVIIPFIDINFSSLNESDSDFLTQIYKTVITMTTVGYGDLTFSQVSDRVKAVFVVILGSFISSVLTLTVLNYFKLTSKQIKAYHLFKRIDLQQKIKKEKLKIAVNTIQLFKKSDCFKRKLQQNDVIGDSLPKYRQKLKESQQNQSFIEFFSRNQGNLMSNVKKLVEKQLIIRNLMKFYYERRQKVEAELQKDSSEDSPHSCKSKGRVQDSKRIMAYLKKILK